MRGALRDAPWVAKGIGIIPAYAGSTLQDPVAENKVVDHPRVCGEHSLGILKFALPRRIIPAYAGST